MPSSREQNHRSIGDSDLGRLAELIRSGLGFNYPEERWPDMLRQLKTLANAENFTTVETCVQWLLADGPQSERLEKLAQYITIGETYFFRDKSMFSLLKKVILPERIKAGKRSTNNKIIVWSAGCSSGEEPYSLAIAIEEIFGITTDKDVQIIGSDINSDILDKARKGVYTSWSLREGSAPLLIPAYFSEVGKNRFLLNAAIREKVDFTKTNLLDPVYPAPLNILGRVDIILCRNVLMYFDHKKRESVVDHFVRLLPPGGWFFVSPTETAVIKHPELECLRFDDTYVFRKTTDVERRKKNEAKKQTKPNSVRFSESTPLTPGKYSIAASVSNPPKKQSKQHLDILDSNSADETRESIKKAFAAAECGNEKEAMAILHGVVDDLRPWLCDIPRQEVIGRLATLYGNCGEFDRGEQMWRCAIEENKINPEPYYHLALTLQNMDRREESLSYLKKVLFLDPDFLLAHLQLAFICENPMEAHKHARIAYSLLDGLPLEASISLSGGMTAGMIKKTLKHIGSGTDG